MIDDTFLKHQLRKEFALEIQALLETYDLAKEDESRHTEPVAGTTALVMKVDAEGNLVSLYIHQLKNRLKTATKELKRGAMRPSAHAFRFCFSDVPTECYDHQGRRLKIRTAPADWRKDPYVIEAFEEIKPDTSLECVSVHRKTFEEATSGPYPPLVKSGLIWCLRAANDSRNWLNHTLMILPPSAIVLQCIPPPAAIWQEGGLLCVYIRQYTGEAANGRQSVAFLWPAR